MMEEFRALILRAREAQSRFSEAEYALKIACDQRKEADKAFNRAVQEREEAEEAVYNWIRSMIRDSNEPPP